MILAVYSIPRPNIALESASLEKVSSNKEFIGPIPYQTPLMIQNGVVFKPNMPSEEAPPPAPKPKAKPKNKVYIALAEAYPVIGQPKQDYADGEHAGQCVSFAKSFLGVGGTWGTGGRNLSPNATAEDADVVIFDYGHIAVKIGLFADGTLVLAESNNDLRGTVEIGRQIKVGDPSIWKYHKF